MLQRISRRTFGRRRLRAALAVLAFVTVPVPPALAASDDDARAAFKEGTALVERTQWAEALAAFERASGARRHAVTTYNIGACERAMGRYTRARRTFAKALAENDASGGKELPESLVTEAKGALLQIDGILVKVTLAVTPPEAKVVVDGRPLEKGDGDKLLAGLRAPGPGEALPKSPSVVILDHGAHVFTFQREGFADAVVNKTFSPGKSESLNVELEKLPATLRITSNRPAALVAVNGVDVGPVPVDVLRPAGTYKVLVRDEGYVPYEGALSVKPGQSSSLKADLAPEKPSIFSRWWFWTAAGVVVAGAATTTYLVTRPEPKRAPVNGGTLGWTVSVP
jgi:hypothetical protein